jgi:predicted membrane protein
MNRNKLVAGIFFTIFGVLLTLKYLDLFDAGRVLRYWPVMLIVFGLMNLGDEARRGVASVAIVAGAALLALRAHWIHFSIWNIWPVMLIVIGGVIVLRALGVAAPEQRSNLWGVLNTRKLTLDPRDLDRRQIVAFMGGTQIDLTDAEFEGPVTVEVLAVWGGIEFRVPSGWEVVVEAVPVMGGIDSKNNGPSAGRRLIVRGLVLMAGMEIKNVRTA